ncbi:MAG TPA: GNAT family N-acetyltransferase [Candidatus Binataceae bacterium]|nr:GNAT family N-acetyltransferase [Candidatus Binataceae bacterium]
MIEYRAAKRAERDEVLDLLARWYNDREFFARYNQNDPTFRDELCVVALDAGHIVSTVQIFDRRINIEGKSLPMGGIGSVFTREDYRHKRVASGLMNLAVTTLEREGFEVSLLFAERLTFYNQFGWKELTRHFSVLPNALSVRAPRFDIDVFDAARDLSRVMELHRAYSGCFDVTAVRDEAAWRANLLFAGNMPADPVGGCDEYFVLVRDGADIVAYARATRFHGIPMVMEYGYAPSHQTAMLALFRHLSEMASRGTSSSPMRGDHRSAALLNGGKPSGNAMLVTHTAHDPDLERALMQAGCPVAHHADNFYMWRVIDAGKLASRFAMPPDAAAQHVFAKFASPHSLFWTSDRF